MSLTVDEIEAAALGLSGTERARLAERLLLSLELPIIVTVENVWAEEAERRHEAMLRECDEGVPAEEVFAELRASLAR